MGDTSFNSLKDANQAAWQMALVEQGRYHPTGVARGPVGQKYGGYAAKQKPAFVLSRSEAIVDIPTYLGFRIELTDFSKNPYRFCLNRAFASWFSGSISRTDFNTCSARITCSSSI